MALQHAATETNSAELLGTLSYGLAQTGEAKRAVPDGKGAIKAYQDAIAVARLLVGLDTGNAFAWYELLARHLNLAVLQTIYGDLPAAQENLKTASLISQELLKIDGNNVNWMYAHSGCQAGQAALDLARGDLLAAQANSQAGLSTAERLTKADLGSVVLKRNVLGAQLGLGDVLLAQGKLDEALRSYQAALSVALALARLNSGSRQAISDQVVALVKVGDVHQKKGDFEASVKSNEAAHPLVQRLIQVNPTLGLWRDLEVSLRVTMGEVYGLLAEQQRNKGEPVAALQNYLSGRAHFQALFNPQGREDQRQLALANFAWKIGTLEGTSMPLSERRAAISQGLEILLDLQRQGKLPAAQAGNPEVFRQALAKLN